MKKEIVCGKENIDQFRRQLKKQMPEFYSLVKLLYKNGLIKGLRGATITQIDSDHRKVEKPPQSTKKAQFCKQCRYWHKDFIGDGYGAGKCDLYINPRTSKYPATPECKEFKEKI